MSNSESSIFSSDKHKFSIASTKGALDLVDDQRIPVDMSRSEVINKIIHFFGHIKGEMNKGSTLTINKPDGSVEEISIEQIFNRDSEN